MRKKCKKIMIIWLIILMIFAFTPLFKTGANDENTSTVVVPGNVERENEEITNNHVTLKKYSIFKDATGGYVDLTVEGYDLEGDLTGFSGTISGIYANFSNSIKYNKTLTEGWSLTSCNSKNASVIGDSNYLSFTVEKKDDFFNKEGNEVSLRIYYEIEENDSNTFYVGMGDVAGLTKFIITDKYNNTVYPLENYQKKWLGIKYSDKKIIELKEEKNKNKAIMSEDTHEIFR